MLTYSVTPDKRISMGNKIMVLGSIAFDSSYPTGGESFDRTQLVLRDLDSIIFEDSGVFSFQYDYTNNKVKVFTAAAAPKAEVADTTDLSSLTVIRFRAIGV